MLSEKEMIEYELLNLLADVDNPVGAVTLSLLLKGKDFNVSSATVGRILTGFDYHGFTAKHGFQGRMLTDAGIRTLTALESKRRLEEVSSKFYDAMDAESKSQLIDVLIARRGIERERARLAAINATEEDIRSISKVYSIQAKDAADGIQSPDNDVLFHRAIARASKNRVLAAAYDFIWQNGHFSPVMEYIRSSVGGILSADHKKILNALIDRNSEEADRYMAEHIDSLIRDVNKYWTMVQGSKEDRTEPA
jgi:GntR family L-lactate dehydrogenase operon transcriptional regulator